VIKPLRDLLVLRVVKEPGKVGRLFVPDLGTSQNKNGCVCEVVAAGPKAVLAKKGDQVHVPAYGDKPASEMEITHEGEKLILIAERDITGVLK
jgi:co-chaperonin GroES (HSP10)